MTPREAAVWIVLGAVWGAAFLFTKVAVADGGFGPFALVDVRLTVAALVLAVPTTLQGGWRHVLARWGTLLALGAVNSAIPFALFAWAMQRSLSAGDGSVLNATSALFAAAIGWVVFRERLSVRKLTGLAVGFGGVVVLVWDKLSFEADPWAMLAGLMAGFLYGVASHIITRRLKGLPPVAVSMGSLMFAAVLLSPAAVADWPAMMPAAGAWGAAVLLGVMCTAAAFLMFFWLMKRIGPTGAMTVAYAIPAFGILWGWLFLGEAVSLATILGGVVIVAGVVMVQWPERAKATPLPAEGT